MSAWCHGAPGIALTRLRAFELTQNDVYKKEALKAIEGSITSLKEDGKSNYSLCHGRGGNCEALIYGYEILGDKQLLEIVESIGLEGIEKYEQNNAPWPCGTMGSVSDPSLMLGEAGIGYYFLRLFDQNVSSVLISSVSAVKDNISKEDDSYKKLQKDYINYYFGNTVDLLNKKNNGDHSFNSKKTFNIGETVSDAVSTFQELKTVLTQKKNNADRILRETFYTETTKFELTLKIEDHSEEYIEELKRALSDKIKLEEYKLELMPYVKTYSTDLLDEAENTDEVTKSHFLFFRKQNRIYTRELGILSYIILNSLEKSSTLENLISKVVEFIEFENDSEYVSIRQTIIQQLKEFYKAGLINIYEPNRKEKIVEENKIYLKD